MAKKSATKSEASTKRAGKTNKGSPKSKRSAKKPTAQKSSPKEAIQAPNLFQPICHLSSRATVVLSGTVPTPERPYLIERLLTPKDVSIEYELRRDELDKGFKKARGSLRKWLPELRKQPQFDSGHITGWSVMFRRSFGHVVSPLQVVIAVNVATKFELNDLDRMGCTELPKAVFGVPIKVLEGSFVFLASALEGEVTRAGGIIPNDPLPLTTPLIGGTPFGPVSDPSDFGTLGIVIEETNGLVGITNHHVIDSNQQAVRLGPAFTAGGTGGTAAIGTASSNRRVLRQKPGLNLRGSVDCAAIDIDGTAAVASIPNAVRELTHLGHALAPTGVELFYATRPVDARDHSLPVLKFGGRSGIKLTGTIQRNAGAEVRIGGKIYKNLIVIENGNNRLVPPGDSGSVMLFPTMIDKKPAYIVAGLFFAQIAGSNSTGIACHFSDVIKALDLKIDATRLKGDWPS